MKTDLFTERYFTENEIVKTHSTIAALINILIFHYLSFSVKYHMCNFYMSLFSHLLVETYIACTLVVYTTRWLTLARPIVYKSYRNIRETKLTMRNYINRVQRLMHAKESMGVELQLLQTDVLRYVHRKKSVLIRVTALQIAKHCHAHLSSGGSEVVTGLHTYPDPWPLVW